MGGGGKESQDLVRYFGVLPCKWFRTPVINISLHDKRKDPEMEGLSALLASFFGKVTNTKITFYMADGTSSTRLALL